MNKPLWEHTPPTSHLSDAQKWEAWEECQAKSSELEAELKLSNKLNNFAEIAQITCILLLALIFLTREKKAKRIVIHKKIK